MIPVPVRFRSAALIKALDFQGFFYVAEDDIDKKYSFGYNKKENTERVIGEKRLCVQQLLIKQKTFILEERWC